MKPSYQVINRLPVVLSEKGRTQAWLADRLGVDSAMVHRIYCGYQVPRVSTALKIANALNCLVEDIWQIKEIYDE